MTNHPHRKGARQGSHPAVAEIRATREEAGQTQTEAAEAIQVALRTWQDYEGGQRKMPPGLFEYYCLQVAFPREMQKLIIRWRDPGRSDWAVK